MLSIFCWVPPAEASRFSMSWHVFLTSLLDVASSVTPLDIVQNAGSEKCGAHLAWFFRKEAPSPTVLTRASAKSDGLQPAHTSDVRANDKKATAIAPIT